MVNWCAKKIMLLNPGASTQFLFLERSSHHQRAASSRSLCDKSLEKTWSMAVLLTPLKAERLSSKLFVTKGFEDEPGPSVLTANERAMLAISICGA